MPIPYRPYRVTARRRALLRLALTLASQYEAGFIAALATGTDPSDVQAAAEAQANIDAFTAERAALVERESER